MASDDNEIMNNKKIAIIRIKEFFVWALGDILPLENYRRPSFQVACIIITIKNGEFF